MEVRIKHIAKNDWSTLDHNTLDKMKVEHRENRYVNKYDCSIYE